MKTPSQQGMIEAVGRSMIVKEHPKWAEMAVLIEDIEFGLSLINNPNAPYSLFDIHSKALALHKLLKAQ